MPVRIVFRKSGKNTCKNLWKVEKKCLEESFDKLLKKNACMNGLESYEKMAAWIFWKVMKKYQQKWFGKLWKNACKNDLESCEKMPARMVWKVVKKCIRNIFGKLGKNASMNDLWKGVKEWW